MLTRSTNTKMQSRGIAMLWSQPQKQRMPAPTMIHLFISSRRADLIVCQISIGVVQRSTIFPCRKSSCPRAALLIIRVIAKKYFSLPTWEIPSSTRLKVRAGSWECLLISKIYTLINPKIPIRFCPLISDTRGHSTIPVRLVIISQKIAQIPNKWTMLEG